MQHLSFLQDLAVVMIVAGVVTILFHRFKQPVVLGYILAGVIIGPHTPPFSLIISADTITTLSELGIVFLMFSLGLEFSLRKLKSVGATAFIAAAFEIVVMVWLGYELGRAFGWKEMDCIFLGAILSISSTTIIIKALEGMGKTREKFAHQIFGVLIIEDILGVVMIALLSGFATTGAFQARDVTVTLVKLSAFLVTLLVLGLILVPRLLDYVSKFKSKEMLLITVMGLCFGVSFLAVKLEYSVALGAFLIGAIIAEARQIRQIEHLVAPIKDLFSAVFFVSIGLLIHPLLLVKYIWPIVIISAVVIVGKIVSCSVGAFVGGNERRSSLRIGMGLSQIGEFSFIIAGMGLTLGVTSDFLYPIAVAVSAITTFTTPYLISNSDNMVRMLEGITPKVWFQYLDAYTKWVGTLGSDSRQSRAWAILRKCAIQVGLNLLLVIALFIVAAYLANRRPGWFTMLPADGERFDEVLWLIAMVLSLPMLIAVIRKLQAIGMLLSEMSVSPEIAGKNTHFFRGLIANTFFTISVAAVVALIALLSSPLLPTWNVFLFLGAILIVIVFLFRRAFVRLHAKAEGALLDTFSKAEEPVEVARVLPAILKDVELLTAPVHNDSKVAGMRIKDLGIRTVSGASIVAIEREGRSIINPAADEVIAGGDQILLLGSQEQLAEAAEMLQK
ncbi:MAG: cation:proton antiporter [Chthoniobacterales bacterium]